jgi:hypothetical protein
MGRPRFFRNTINVDVMRIMVFPGISWLVIIMVFVALSFHYIPTLLNGLILLGTVYLDQTRARK